MTLNASLTMGHGSSRDEGSRVASSWWTRNKAWAARTYRKAAGTARRAWTSLASKVQKNVVVRKAVASARRLGTAMAAVAPHVLRSLRSFARTCLVFAGVAAWLATFLAAPVPMLFATFAGLGATAAIGVVLGWLDTRKSPLARVSLTAIDGVVKIIGVTLEVAVGAFAVNALAATRMVFAIPQALAFAAWTTFDATQRLRKEKGTVARVEATRKDAQAVAERGRAVRDPFARASSRMAVASVSR